MDINKVMSGLGSSGLLGGLAGGAVSGTLMSNKKARKTAGTLLKAGGLAALGGLAWKAHSGYQESQKADGHGPAPVPADPAWQNLPKEGFQLENKPPVEFQRDAILLIHAMAGAAHADGHLDATERQRILQRAGAMDLAPDEKALVFEVLNEPLSMSALCEQVECPELAAEIYLTSALVMERTSPESRLYLDGLAFSLGLPEPLAAQLHQTIEETEAQLAHEAA